jgi:phage/plasmid-like protein (TIGR03299 family)
MAHELSTVNGRVEMFSGNNVVPWHKLGTVVAGTLTAKEAIIAAHLDWQVQGLPVTVNGRQLAFPTEDNSSDCWQGITRMDTGDCLGIMKGRYETIQNRDCFDFMDSLVSDGKLKYETAGALRGGRQVWMMAKYDGDLTINGDAHKQYLLLVSSHDGSYSLMVQWVTVRVVCANTLSLALRNVKNQVKIRHTSNWSEKSAEASRVLGLTEDYFAKMQETLSGLNQQPLNPDDARAFTKLLLPADDESNVPTRTTNMRDDILARYNCPATGTHGQSRWDMLNAVTDYADHAQSLRGKNSTRLESSLLGSGAALKNTAATLLLSPLDELLNRTMTAPSSPVLPQHNPFAALLGN